MAELQRLAALSPDWDWSTCAVIAREWKYLEPVRAFCELHRIPAQMGNEEIPSFWHLRETRTLIEWLRGRETRIVGSADLRGWLDAQTPGLWNDLLRQALDEFSLETSDAEMPVDHFIEWLAEWGRDVRRRQRGLLLLTAHRAKGLEFDHVAVLDGGWNNVDKGEDPDAPRRLYYVAMTRARQTLALVRFQGSRPAGGSTRPDFVKEPDLPAYLGRLHSLPYTFPNNGSVLRRTSGELQPEIPELSRQYRRPSLREVYLSFAGRLYANHPVHRAIAALSPGDQLETRITKNGYWELLNRSGMVVGRLARAFEPPPGTRCRSAKVFAVVAWSREASEPQYRDSMKCDAWEVVVPELVFELEGE